MVTLDTPRPSDTVALVRLFTEAAVREYLGGPLSLTDAERRVEGLIAGNIEGKMWTIRADAGQAIGLVWLAPYHHGADTELSVVILPEWQGRGHAFHAASQVLEAAFGIHGLPRVVAETQSANTRCLALLGRLGMKLERKLQRFGAEQSLYSIMRPDEI